MDCVDQAGSGGTVLLESYESSCDETVPLHPTPAVGLDKETTVEMDTQKDYAGRLLDKPLSAATVSGSVAAVGSDVHVHESGANEVKGEEGITVVMSKCQSVVLTASLVLYTGRVCVCVCVCRCVCVCVCVCVFSTHVENYPCLHPQNTPYYHEVNVN